MKRENLQLMANHLKISVKQVNFNMDQYRGNYDFRNPVCGSAGCTIGTCSVLDVENVIKNFTDSDGRIEFHAWSEDFTGLLGGEDEWEWCFGPSWKTKDNTPTGAALRIEWLLNHGLPENWKNQMYDDDELCYM